MSLGAWILFWSEAGNAPPVISPAIGLFVVLYVSGCAFSDALDAPSFAGLVATGPAQTVTLDAPSFAGELVRARL